MSDHEPMLELTIEDHQEVATLEQQHHSCWEIGLALEALHDELVLSQITPELSIERDMVQTGNPLYRIVSAILAVSEKAYEATKTMMKTLVDGRRRLLEKARNIRDEVKRVGDDASKWNGGELKLPDHLRFLMIHRGQLSANTVIVDIDSLHKGNINLVDATINYFKGFDRVVEASDRAGDILNGTLENVTEINQQYLKDLQFDDRKKRIGSINYVAPYIGGLKYDVETKTIERKDVLTHFRVEVDNPHRGGTIRATSLPPNVALSMMDAVVGYLSEVVITRNARNDLEKRHEHYKENLSKLYQRFYKTNVPTHVGTSLAPYINDINRRDVGRKSLQVITNVERHLYRVCLAVMIWVNGSMK